MPPIETEHRGRVGWIWLSRPEKRNALSEEMWDGLPRAAAQLGDDPSVRVVVVAGRGPAFTVGIDLEYLAGFDPPGASEADRNRRLFQTIRRLQASFTALEDLPQPVIAAVHGWCLGAGVDLITACDLRLASADAVFSVRETRMGIVPDVGTLQRLPGIVGWGHVAELVYTADDFDAATAHRMGLVNRVSPDVETLWREAQDLAEGIASMSPMAVQGAKAVLRASRRREIQAGLEYVALWNAAFLRSNDLTEALSAFLERRPPSFPGD
jgi:enoyl-CoA hydratase